MAAFNVLEAIQSMVRRALFQWMNPERTLIIFLQYK